MGLLLGFFHSSKSYSIIDDSWNEFPLQLQLQVLNSASHSIPNLEVFSDCQVITTAPRAQYLLKQTSTEALKKWSRA